MGSRTNKTITLLAEKCLNLTGYYRWGCIYGLGNAYVTSVYQQPDLIKMVCSFGNSQDKDVCIEGVIERLAKYKQSSAFKTCEYFEGKHKELCIHTAEQQMYSLEKSFEYYIPGWTE